MGSSKKYKLSLEKNFYIWILLFFIGVLGYLNFQILKSFFEAIGWAIVIALIFHPIFDFLKKFLKYNGLAALLTILVVIFLFLLPFSFVSYKIIIEATELVKRLNISEIVEKITTNPILGKVIEKLSYLFGGDLSSFENLIRNELGNLVKEIALKVAHGFSGFVSMLINLVLTFFIAFFFIQDGHRYINKLFEFLPFSEPDKVAIKMQIKDIIYATFYGGILIAIIQGSLLGITFYFLEIPSATLWGFVTAVASFVPVLGPFIIWGPASLYLLFNGYILKGIILVLVGGLIISSVDNVLKPLVLKGKVKLPLIFIFLSVLGGIKVFGLIGFLIGPIVFSLFVSFLEILKNFVGGGENV